MGCVTVEYFAGDNFAEVLRDMRRLKNILSCSIKTSMNGVEVVVMGDKMDIEEAVSQIVKKIGTDDKFLIVK